MTPKRTDAQPDLFDRPLFGLIDMNHPLVKLAGQFDWESLRLEVAPSFCDDNVVLARIPLLYLVFFI